MTAVRERTFATPTEKLMMMVLCDYIDGDDLAWPGNDTLAQDVGVDVRTIKRSLSRLAEAGVVGREPRWSTTGQGGRAVDAIRFRWDEFQRLPLVRDGGDLGDNLSGDLGDIDDRVRGHSGGGLRGQSGNRSSYRTPQVEPPTNPVVVVFDAWRSSTGRNGRTVLDPKRRRLIAAALATYPLDDVLDAVRGWEHSPHHRGENDAGHTYNDLGLLLRDATHIEQFRDLARGPRRERTGQAVAEPRAFAALAERRRLVDESDRRGKVIEVSGRSVADVPDDRSYRPALGRAPGEG